MISSPLLILQILSCVASYKIGRNDRIKKK